ncbi:hypothetical protein WISP_146957 [Willisornis vidua]|uniref:Uncharacterized protein n=1 Tax=Willisornis vidua TaxID=1566151 RepID=A0ABQ9CKP6_9PASS|nr:hypothetical protein WISP_146957 [Willisornis vidua]
MLEQFVKNCSLLEGLMLEHFVEDCLTWEGPHAGVGEECEESPTEEEGVAEITCDELAATLISLSPVPPLRNRDSQLWTIGALQIRGYEDLLQSCEVSTIIFLND